MCRLFSSAPGALRSHKSLTTGQGASWWLGVLRRHYSFPSTELSVSASLGPLTKGPRMQAWLHVWFILIYTANQVLSSP